MEILVLIASIIHKHKLLHSPHVHLFKTQYIYKLQQYIIPLLLPTGQCTMHRGLLNEKSLGPFRQVRPTDLDFQARPVAISNHVI